MMLIDPKSSPIKKVARLNLKIQLMSLHIDPVSSVIKFSDGSITFQAKCKFKKTGKSAC